MAGAGGAAAGAGAGGTGGACIDGFGGFVIPAGFRATVAAAAAG